MFRDVAEAMMRMMLTFATVDFGIISLLDAFRLSLTPLAARIRQLTAFQGVRE